MKAGEHPDEYAISAPWSSFRDGARLYPAVLGAEGGSGPTVDIVVDYATKDQPIGVEPEDSVSLPYDDFDVEQEEQDGTVDTRPSSPLQFSFEISMDGAQSFAPDRLNLEIYGLASADVQQFLSDDTAVQRDKRNFAAFDIKADGTTKVFFPPIPTQTDEFRVPGEPELYADRFELDYLDRIVFSTRSALQYRFRQKHGPRLDAKGTRRAVLAIADAACLQEDEGALRQKLFTDLPGKIDNSTFIKALQDAGRTVTQADMEDHSIFAAFGFSEVTWWIKERQGGMQARLAPRSIDDFLSMPAYGHLLANVEKIDGKSRVVSRRFNPGDMVHDDGTPDEGQHCGQLASSILRSRRDLPDIQAERLELWVQTCLGKQTPPDDGQASYVPMGAAKPNVGDPWDIVPVAIQDPLRELVQNGVNFEVLDFGPIVEELCRNDFVANVNELGGLVDELTLLGLLPMTFEAQFISFTEVTDRLNDLSELKERATEYVVSAEDVLQVRVGPNRDINLFFDVLDFAKGFDPRREGKNNSASVNRVAGYLAGRLESDGFATKSASAPVLNRPRMNRQLAMFFADRMRGDIEMVDRIVACGYPDPLPQAQQDVLPMYKTSGQISQGASGFADRRTDMIRTALGVPEQEWLFDQDQSRFSDLVNMWREFLAEAYMTENGGH